MTGITIVAPSRDRLAALRAVLPDDVTAVCLRLEDLPRSEPTPIAILDIDLNRPNDVQAIQTWRSSLSRPGTVIVCVAGRVSHLQLTQAYSLGATAVLSLPLQAAHLHRILDGIKESFAPAPQTQANDPTADLQALENIFAVAGTGQSPDMERATQAGARIVDGLREIGLSRYLSAIHNHHSRTYTHCLTVTAVAVAFGMQLGFSRTDTERLAVAGLLHDIGKSQIPLSILEKPAALTCDEREIMRTHPVLGYEILRGTPGLPDATLDMILHHHEYLDGSGYPHGLQGSQISDLNRIMTIADIYGALIEPRSYKPPLSAAHAFDVLHRMGSQLDTALVRAFSPLAENLAA